MIEEQKLNESSIDIPLVSVVMNCFNCEQYLHEAISSVFNQTYQNWEIIFWDNASSDASEHIAKSFGDKLKYFHSEKTVLLYEARQLALDKCKGEFIAFLDCDDVWLKNKLELQTPYFSDKKIGLVHSNSVSLYLDGSVGKPMLSNDTKYSGNCLKELIQRYFLDIETVIFRSDILRQKKIIFNKNYSHIGDADFFIRISAITNFGYTNEVLSKWRVHGDNLSLKEPEKFYIEGIKMAEDLKTYLSEYDCETEISRMKSRYVISKALNLWAKGNGQEARLEIKNNTSISLKASVVYLLSFFPFRFACPIIKKLFRGRLLVYSESC